EAEWPCRSLTKLVAKWLEGIAGGLAANPVTKCEVVIKTQDRPRHNWPPIISRRKSRRDGLPMLNSPSAFVRTNKRCGSKIPTNRDGDHSPDDHYALLKACEVVFQNWRLT